MFWKDSQRIGELLTGHGFRILELLDPEETEKRHVTLADGSPGEKALPPFRFIFVDSAETIR